MDILLIVKEKSHSLFASVSISDMSLYYRYILVDVMYTSEILTQTFVKFLTNHSINIDHAKGDIRINEGTEVVVEKEWQQLWNVAVTVRGVQLIL